MKTISRRESEVSRAMADSIFLATDPPGSESPESAGRAWFEIGMMLRSERFCFHFYGARKKNVVFEMNVLVKIRFEFLQITV